MPTSQAILRLVGYCRTILAQLFFVVWLRRSSKILTFGLYLQSEQAKKRRFEQLQRLSEPPKKL